MPFSYNRTRRFSARLHIYCECFAKFEDIFELNLNPFSLISVWMLDMQWQAKQTRKAPRDYRILCTSGVKFLCTLRLLITILHPTEFTHTHTHARAYPFFFFFFSFWISSFLGFWRRFSCFSSSTIYNRFSSIFLCLFSFHLRSVFFHSFHHHHCCWHRYVACYSEHIKSVRVYFCSRSTLITSSFDSFQHQLHLFCEISQAFPQYAQANARKENTSEFKWKERTNTHTRTQWKKTKRREKTRSETIPWKIMKKSWWW